MRMKRLSFQTILASAFIFVIGFAGTPRRQGADWTEPFPSFKIAGNLYYVGSKGLASYLITTPQGHILINSNLEESVPLIPGQRGTTRIQVYRHQDPANQPRPL